MADTLWYPRTRPFRYLGFWTLAGSWLLLAEPMLAGAARAPAQVWGAVVFCCGWPWVADRLRACTLQRPGSRLEGAAYWLECAVVAALLAWASVPLLPGMAAAVCLLAGAMALAGWRLLLPALAMLLLGAGVGAWLAPQRTGVSTRAADLLALALIVGFVLALAHQSYRQAVRLGARRRDLAEQSATLQRQNARMQRYLPPSLRERLSRAPEEPWRWERRWLTVAFVDLVGFTELSERLDAELLAGILDEYLGALIPAAERRAGEVSKLLGDGVLVVFGLRERGDRRAAAGAALAFCQALPTLLDGLAMRWRDRGELVKLQMRAGIASGYCTLGDRGGAGRLDFTLIGPPVNLASRLQAHADVDGLLLDEASALLAEPTQRLGPPRRMALKGLGATVAFPLACRVAAAEAS